MTHRRWPKWAAVEGCAGAVPVDMSWGFVRAQGHQLANENESESVKMVYETKSLSFLRPKKLHYMPPNYVR